MTDTCTATRHGTRIAYDTYKCRCPGARAASTRARKTRRARQLRGGSGLVPAIGTARRLRALSANGWSMETIATELGWEWQRVADLRRSPRPHVNITTRAAVAAVYDRLADHRGPSTRAAVYAANRGWLPPLWWDDDTIDDPTYTPPIRDTTTKHDLDPVAVDRACAGLPPERLTVAERAAAVARLAGHGYSDTEIATVLGGTRDGVARRRQRHSIPAAVPTGRTAGVA